MKKLIVLLFATLMALSISSLSPASIEAQKKVSKPGEYGGYSSELYDGWKRFSQYVTVRDGARLAIDYYRPTKGGVVAAQPFPVAFAFTPYIRAQYLRDKGVETRLLGRAQADSMTKYGYVVAVADVRGTGASYGFRETANDRVEAWDAHDLIEWIAVQPWCDGNVGTWGLSYYGQTQLEALSTQPPHLKASFIGETDFDKYDGWSRNTIPRRSGGEVTPNPAQEVLTVVPVDGDVDGDGDGRPDQLWEAVNAHVKNGPFTGLVTTIPYRNSLSPLYLGGTKPFWEDCSARTYLPEFRQSKTPVYIIAGWYDLFRRDSMVHFANWPGPVKMIIGPWRHGDDFAEKKISMDLMVECLRFFDYWLKGIDNGIMDEPPIYYNVMDTPVNGTPKAGIWRFTSQWPLQTAAKAIYYLHAGRSGTATSVNDGKLNKLPPSETMGNMGKDDYTVDYGISANVEPLSSMPVVWGPGPNGTELDQKGLTYTTDPLEADLEVTGHPMVQLWVSSDNKDGDFMVFLEDVDPTGKSTYITDGRLRASLRAVTSPPYDFLGLPWHRAYREDEMLLTPGQPVKLYIDMMPTSYVFKTGNRIRFTVAGSQDRIYDLKKQDSPHAPESVSVYRNKILESFVELPVVVKVSVPNGP
jgi:uncharacterized protein